MAPVGDPPPGPGPGFGPGPGPKRVGRAAACLADGKNRWITSGPLRQAVTEALAAAGPRPAGP